MGNTPTLQTERLLLRKFTPADLEAVFSIFSDREVNTFLPMFPLETIEEAALFLKEKYLDNYARSVGYQYAICLKTDNRPIGYVHVSGEESHDLGYGLLTGYWHRGIVTEAAAAVMEELRRAGYSHVTATHDIHNPRSGEVMKKIGMTYRYSYEEQWQPKDIPVTFRMYQSNFDGREDWVYTKYWEQYPVHFVEKDVSDCQKRAFP